MKNTVFASKEALQEMLNKSSYKEDLVSGKLQLKIFFICEILEVFKNKDLEEKGYTNVGVKITKCDLVPALVGLNIGALYSNKALDGGEPLKARDIVSGSMDMKGQTWVKPKRVYLSKEEKESLEMEK